MPTEIGRLTQLTVLQTFFTGVRSIPTQLGQLTSLTALRFMYSGLYFTIPTEVGLLTRMSIFQSTYGVKGTIPTEVGNWKLITRFLLEASGLRGTIPTQVGLLTLLTRFEVRAGQMNGTIPEVMGGLTRLRRFLISGNQFTGTIPDIMRNCTLLERVSIDRNKFSGTVPAAFLNLTRLTYLDCSNNLFTGRVPSALNYLIRLRHFILSANLLTGTIPRILTLFPNLTVVQLSSNSLQGTIPIAFGTSSVKRLLLNNNFLTAPTFGNTLPYWIRADQYIDVSINVLPVYSGEVETCLENSAVNITDFGACQNLVYHPQDVDDCAEGSHQCPENAFCSNGLSPRLSYTCRCNAGYSLTGTSDLPNEKTCVDIDECQRGHNCTFRQLCVNTIGSFQCCGRGYIAFNSSYCVDVDECNPDSVWSNNCTFTSQCINTNGSFYCCGEGFIRDSQGTGCIDVNECVAGSLFTHNCSLQASCRNTFGSFECCPRGYQPNSDGTSCIDVNECIPGSLYQHTCPLAASCVNEIGSFRCCEEGYEADKNTLLECVDVNECLPGSLYVHDCPSLEHCINEVGSYRCCNKTLNEIAKGGECVSCFGDWTLHYSNLTQYPSLAKYKDYPFHFKTCVGSCERGVILETRSVVASSCFDFGVDTLRQTACSYACQGLSFADSPKSAMETLRTELSKDGFLRDIIWQIFRVNITIGNTTDQKRSNDFGFSITAQPCQSQDQIVSLLKALSADIIPNAPGLDVAADPATCSFGVQSSTPDVQDNKALIIGLIVGFLVAALALLLLIYWIHQKFFAGSLVEHLPPEIAWSFLSFENSVGKRGWEFQGTKSAGYYHKTLERGTEEYQKAMTLWDALSGKSILQIKSIQLIYNSVLLTSFSNTYVIQRERIRADPEFWNKKTWNQHYQNESAWVFEKFQNLKNRYPWNLTSDGAVILPACHATDYSRAGKICQTGFAALSSVDAGYFGRGIYFTSHSAYCVPYLQTKHPSVIVSYILPGNPYPVVEEVKSPMSLLGSALKMGFNSHFVVTNVSGECVTSQEPNETVCDEIVIPQESQIVPAFIFTIDKKNTRDLRKDWERMLPTYTETESSIGEVNLKGKDEVVVPLDSPNQPPVDWDQSAWNIFRGQPNMNDKA